MQVRKMRVQICRDGKCRYGIGNRGLSSAVKDDTETSNSEMMQKQLACHFCHSVISKAL